jgi:hypothetical protein
MAATCGSADSVPLTAMVTDVVVETNCDGRKIMSLVAPKLLC